MGQVLLNCVGNRGDMALPCIYTCTPWRTGAYLGSRRLGLQDSFVLLASAWHVCKTEKHCEHESTWLACNMVGG